MFELTSEERRHLLDVLEAAHTQLLAELSHTDAREYQRDLRERLAVNERIAQKLVTNRAA